MTVDIRRFRDVGHDPAGRMQIPNVQTPLICNQPMIIAEFDPSKSQVEPLSFPFQTLDPFLFAVYHLDEFPAGNEELGLNKSQLKGRNIGSDFSGVMGSNKWSMYHGEKTPGFPRISFQNINMNMAYIQSHCCCFCL